MNSPVGLSRRDFARYLLAGSAVSLSALEKLSADIAQSITSSSTDSI